MALPGVANRGVVLPSALQASGGRLAAPQKVVLTQAVVATATSLEDVLTINERGYSRTTGRWMALFTVAAAWVGFDVLGG